MWKFLLLLLLLLLIAGLGCGGEAAVPPERAYDPEKLTGSVDTSLPGQSQARQQAVKSVFDRLQEGIDFDSLPEYVADVHFQESPESFLEGTLNLARWNFNGTPTGDDVPVVLSFNKDSTGRNQQEFKRVYTVTGSPGRWTISRKP